MTHGYAHTPTMPQGLLSKRVERFAFHHQKWLPWIHAAMFVGFLVLIVVPLLLPAPNDNARLFHNFTLTANFLIWGFWFPLVFVSVIFTGRSWCGVLCPMGASSEWVNRIGLKRMVPRWIRWEGAPVVSFIVITILAQTVDARSFPEGIAVVFGLTLACALIVGFLYGPGYHKRTWCRHLCPIGLTLGSFSRLGMVQFAPKKPRIGAEALTDKGVCPTFIDINRKRESRHCIECLRCVQPNAKGGLAIHLRKPGSEAENIRDHHPHNSDIWFLFLGTGVAIGGFLWLTLPLYWQVRHAIAVWAIGNGWLSFLSPGPAWLMSVHPAGREVFTWLDFSMITGFMLATGVVFALALSACTALGSWMSGLLGGDKCFRHRFLELAYQYLPVAMVSLVIGLGSELFALLERAIGATPTHIIEVFIFSAGLAWSLHIGRRILMRQGLAGSRLALALVPSLLGCTAAGIIWWPALFGA
ncbi:MAG: 4Fe-4S binding protein [Gammaproteobacteria bacterium]|nr:4Fe-4S binding protein [Gammaproteobacteria bacterium]